MPNPVGGCTNGGGTSGNGPGLERGFGASSSPQDVEQRTDCRAAAPRDQHVVRTVGMITTAKQAVAIVTDGKADMVALARAFLNNPHWGWHAAQALSADVARPMQYQRPAPKLWPGAAFARLTTEEAGAAVQGARRVATTSHIFVRPMGPCD
jgi:hypothetical protein